MSIFFPPNGAIKHIIPAISHFPKLASLEEPPVLVVLVGLTKVPCVVGAGVIVGVAVLPLGGIEDPSAA